MQHVLFISDMSRNSQRIIKLLIYCHIFVMLVSLVEYMLTLKPLFLVVCGGTVYWHLFFIKQIKIVFKINCEIVQ
jgi:hypothetical protein